MSVAGTVRRCGGGHYAGLSCAIPSQCLEIYFSVIYLFGVTAMKNKLLFNQFSRVILLLVALAMSGVAALAQDEEQRQADRSLSPYFFVDGDPNVDHLPLKDTRVDISVSGIIADVNVIQTYHNEGSRPINATYVFPASTRAAVYSMRMKIGDQVIYAKIKEREAAKQEFEKARQEGKSASLLEENRPNVFSMKLANIMPQDLVEIELRYTEMLVPTDGVYEMVYPTVVGPRYMSDKSKSTQPVGSAYLHQASSPNSSLHISARISAGVPIEGLSCTSHQITPEYDSPNIARLVMEDTDPFQGNRDFILHYKLSGADIRSGLILYRGEDENFFLYMAQPPQRLALTDIPPREYVFIVDVSGSMEGFPIATAKQLLADLVGKMRPSDYFNVVLFAGDSTVLSNKPLEASQANVSRAIQLLEQQRGAGGTELLPAMKTAMSLPRTPGVSRSIVLVTDGYIDAEHDVFDYIRSNLDNCNVFPFGIGSAVNRFLIEGIAKAGMGEAFVVTKASEAAATADSFREYVQSPVLTDVQVRANGFDVYDVNPVHLPDLFAQRPVIVYGKWRGPVGGTFELSGRNANGEFNSSFDVASVSADSSNPALRYLWARSRIAELSDYGFGDISSERVKAITALGLKYNLLTKYTSFIAVREFISNPSGKAQEVNQPLPLPEGVSDLAIGSEPEMVWLIALIAAAIFLLYMRKQWKAGSFNPLF
jgi:Ca-activated chloride channel homolog